MGQAGRERERERERERGREGGEGEESEAKGEHRTDVTKPLRGAYELVINVVSQWPLRDKCSSWEK